jgi:hypothetical protein
MVVLALQDPTYTRLAFTNATGNGHDPATGGSCNDYCGWGRLR